MTELPTWEAGTVNRLSTSAVVVGEVSSLEHELERRDFDSRTARHWEGAYAGDDAVEYTSAVAKPVLARSKLAEVSRRFGNRLVEELEYNASGRFRVNGNVKLCFIMPRMTHVNETALNIDESDLKRHRISFIPNRKRQ